MFSGGHTCQSVFLQRYCVHSQQQYASEQPDAQQYFLGLSFFTDDAGAVTANIQTKIRTIPTSFFI